MALTELPSTYTAPTGIINATAAAEVVVLMAQFKALIADPSVVFSGEAAATPDFYDIPPATAKKLRDEVDALTAALAAAPAS